MSDQLYRATANVLFKSGEAVFVSSQTATEDDKAELEEIVEDLVKLVSDHYGESDGSGYIRVGDTVIRLDDTAAITFNIETYSS